VVGGNPSGDEDAAGAEGFLRGEGLSEQVADDGVLEAGDQVQSLRVGGGQGVIDGGPGGGVRTGEKGFATRLGLGAEIVEFDVAKNRRFDTGKREEKPRIEVGDWRGCSGLGARRFSTEVDLGLDLREREWDGVRVAVLGERVDPWTAGVAKAEKLGDFVVGLSGCVVDGAAHEGVGPGTVGGAGEVKMRVAPGGDESECGLIGVLPAFVVAGLERLLPLAFVEQDGVNVAF